MSEAYLYKSRYLKRIRELYLNIDQNDSNSISINEFFDLIQIMMGDPKFELPYFPDFHWWHIVRHFFNQYLKFKKIAKSVWFEIFMFLILGVNCGVIIATYIVTDEDELAILDLIDGIILYFYIAECIIQMIGLGIQKYFEDDWNKFDFFMVIISVATDAFYQYLVILRSAKSAKAGKLVRITKLNRVFKVFRAMRTFRFLNAILGGAEAVAEVKWLILKTIMCVPLILQFIPIFLLNYYIFGIIGIETFNTKTHSYMEGSPYVDNDYTNLETLGNTFLIFFQITIEAGWNVFIFDYSYKFGNFAKAAFFFDGFHMVTCLIMLSIAKGIVWQVFQVVDDFIKIKQNKKSMMELIDDTSIQKIQQYLQQSNKKKRRAGIFQALHQGLASIQQNLENNSEEGEHQESVDTTNEIDQAAEEYRKILKFEFNRFMTLEKKLPSIKPFTITKKKLTNSQNLPAHISNTYTEVQVTENMSFVENSAEEQLNSKPKSLQKIPDSDQNSYFETDFIGNGKNQELSPTEKKSELSRLRHYQTIKLKNQQYIDQKTIIIQRSEEEDAESNRNSDNKIFSMNKFGKQKTKDSQNETFTQGNKNAQKQIFDQQVEKQENIVLEDEYYVEELKLSGPLFREERTQNQKLSQIGSDSVGNLQRKSRNSVSYSMNKSQVFFTKINRDSCIEGTGIIGNGTNKDMQGYTSQQLQLFQDLKKKLIPLKQMLINQYITKPYYQQQFNMNQDLFDSDDDQGVILFMQDVVDLLENSQSDSSKDDLKILMKYQIEQRNKGVLQGKISIDNQEDDKSLNLTYVMKRALLKDANIEVIQKFETDYFQQRYGIFFKTINSVDVKPIFRLQSNLLYCMERSLHHNNLSDFFVQGFLNVIQGMETLLSDLIFSKGSTFKFVYQVVQNLIYHFNNTPFPTLQLQDNKDNWFSINYTKTQDYEPYLLGTGIWTYLNKVLLQEEEIYYGKDFLTNSNRGNPGLKVVIDEIRESIRLLSQGVDRDVETGTFNFEQSIYDIYGTFFTMNEQNLVTKFLNKLKKQKFQQEFDGEKSIQLQVPMYIQNIMMILVLYKGEQDELQNEQLHRNTNLNSGIQNSHQLSFVIDADTIQNQQRLKNLTYESLQQKDISEKDLISEQTSLPYSYVMELFKNFKDIIQARKENYFFLLSKFLILYINKLDQEKTEKQSKTQ